MNVLLLSPWGTPCGIAEYAAYLVATVQAADPTIVVEIANAPTAAQIHAADLVHLNHSQGTGRLDQILALSVAKAHHRRPVVVTQHDTFERWTIMQERGFPDFRAVDALVVHEPVEGLGAYHYWRQGVPAREPAQALLVTDGDEVFPVLGTVGFPLAWKNYALLAEATRDAGWALLLLAPGATPEQIAAWQAINPWTQVVPTFQPAGEIVARLSGCDATAFLYNCGNSGTSAAIRQGLAARKPLFCTACRQFRDLLDDPESRPALRLVPGTAQGLACGLRSLDHWGEDPQVARLADRDAWSRLGASYAKLYRSLV